MINPKRNLPKFILRVETVERWHELDYDVNIISETGADELHNWAISNYPNLVVFQILDATTRKALYHFEPRESKTDTTELTILLKEAIGRIGYGADNIEFVKRAEKALKKVGSK